jgi:hypothetical protein
MLSADIKDYPFSYQTKSILHMAICGDDLRLTAIHFHWTSSVEKDTDALDEQGFDPDLGTPWDPPHSPM